MQAVVALDVGTTGAKAVLVGRDGALSASGYAGYATQTRGNRVEQDPRDWWAATCAALSDLRTALHATDLKGVVLSGQMQDLILIAEDDALGNAILYSDSRAEAEAESLAETVGADELSRVTGNGQGASSVLAKWLWLRRHEAARLQRAQTILIGAHDYVSWRLCGAVGADFTTAATTGLMELAANQWAAALLDRLDLDASLLPPLQSAHTVAGEITTTAAEATDLPAGTPVYRGAGDLGATTVGVGAGVPGRAYAYLGTSGWIAATRTDAVPAPERGIFTLRHPDPHQFIQVAPMLTAGGNLDWARSGLLTTGASGATVPYETVNALVAQAPAGSNGVIYLPYLAGERSPFTDPNARACFIGISAQVGQADLVRAVMEGTAFAYRSLGETLGGDQSGPLLLAGGGGNSVVWMQILADVLGRPVHVAADPGNAAARGAAVIAGQALGWFESYLPGERFFPVASIYEPQREAHALYNQLYPVFQELHGHLESTFRQLAHVE